MKFIRHFFILCFAIQIIGLGIIELAPRVTMAAEPITFKQQIPIPGTAEGGKYDFSQKEVVLGAPSTAPLAEYIRWVYKYLIGIVGIMSTVMLMFGGFRWIMGAADSGAISEAKSTIASSLVGLTLVVTSYLILSTVNPALVNVKPRTIATISAMGCCDVQIKEATCGLVAQKDCKSGYYSEAKGNYNCINNKCALLKNETIESSDNGVKCGLEGSQCKLTELHCCGSQKDSRGFNLQCMSGSKYINDISSVGNCVYADMSEEVKAFYNSAGIDSATIGLDEGQAACIKLGGTCKPYPVVLSCPGSMTRAASLGADPCQGANTCCK